jgi:NADPH:quinone reductase
LRVAESERWLRSSRPEEMHHGDHRDDDSRNPGRPQTAFRVASIARPRAGQRQVLVRIIASGINPLDTKIHAGQAAHARQPLPNILGINLAGIVDALGDGVSGLRSGDEVYGMTGGGVGLQGSLAEYAAVDADLLAPKPANLTMREAASLPR